MKLSTRQIATAGILAALAIILKTYLSITMSDYRFTFFDLPLMIAGIAFGPFVGGVTGFITDFVYATQSPYGFSFNLMTVSSIMWGVVPGLYVMIKKDLGMKSLIFIVIITSIIAFSLNTYQLTIWYGEGGLATLPARLITLVVKWPIQVYVLHELHKRVLIPLKIVGE